MSVRLSDRPLPRGQTKAHMERSTNRFHTAVNQPLSHSGQRTDFTQRSTNRFRTAVNEPISHSGQPTAFTQRSTNRFASVLVYPSACLFVCQLDPILLFHEGVGLTWRNLSWFSRLLARSMAASRPVRFLYRYL